MSTPMVFVVSLAGACFAVRATSVEPGPTRVTAVLDGDAVMHVGVATPWAFLPEKFYDEWRKASAADTSVFGQIFGPRRR